MNSNPVALVTGGSRRVGRVICLALAGAGYDVALTSHGPSDETDAVAKSIRDQGYRALVLSADLTQLPSAVDQINAEFSANFDRLDLLVHNASVYHPSGMNDATVEQMRQMWSVHVEAPLLLCRAFAGRLREAHGAVINMVDILAQRPRPAYAGYCASKAALENLTLSLARELAPRVTVNGIAPGVVEWPDDMPESARQAYLSRVPLGRAGTPEDVARTVIFLARDARYITGQIIRLDGGRMLA